MHRFAALVLALLIASSAAASLPPPRFADPERARKLSAAFPEVDRLFKEWVERRHVPGAVAGIIIDGNLVWSSATGVRDVETGALAARDTLFRIASMTKSFTAMAVLKLRDEGKLSLDDPVARYVPELAALSLPTKDSPVLTIRHLLTHSEGFPEDNPWGDRQLAQTNATMSEWMRRGIPFSNAPGVAFEYSNYGFAILGQIVERVSGKPYATYIRENILSPLGMASTTFDTTAVPRDRTAFGYRWEDGKWKLEPALAHGSFGAMGGLWTSLPDLARYVAFQMSAYPPRDDAEAGPIRRSSLREMQQSWRSSPAAAGRRSVDAPLELIDAAYGYGLGISSDCRFRHVVGHGGGLPGYGSYMTWLPEYGVGLIGMANLTYASPASFLNEALDVLARTGALQPRVMQPAPELLRAKDDVSQLITKWDEKLAARIAADNLFLDTSAERRSQRFAELANVHGACSPAGEIDAGNALRGRWRMTCERGWLNVAITLAPTMPPRVQFLSVESVLPPDEAASNAIASVLQLMRQWNDKQAASMAASSFDQEKFRRQISAAARWGDCRAGEPFAGDGTKEVTVRLNCDRGVLLARMSFDPEGRKVKSLDLTMAPRDQRCAP